MLQGGEDMGRGRRFFGPFWYRTFHGGPRRRGCGPWCRRAATLLVGLAVGLGGIAVVEAKIRPAIAHVAQAQAQNIMTAVLDRALTESLSGAADPASYASLVEIQRDSQGAITALVTNVSAMNALRARMVEEALEALEALDVHEIQVPLGSSVDCQLFWGRGPAISARSITVGTVQAEFVSEFTQAGINQTRHRIVLEICVPLTLIMAGGTITTQVETNLPVAETILVGQVPSAYLQSG